MGPREFQHGDNVRALRYVANGQSILATTSSIGWDQDIGLALWDSATGQLQRLTHVLNEKGPVPSGLHGPPPQGWQVSPNGELLVTFNVPARKDGGTVYSPIVVRELATGRTLIEIKGESFLQFSPDSNTLATVGESVKLYDLSSGQVRHVVPIDKTKVSIKNARFTPDGHLLVMVGFGAEAWAIHWWHVGRGGAVTALSHRPYTKEKGWYGAPAAGSIIMAPDSKHVAVVSKAPEHQSPHLLLVAIESDKVVRDFGELSVLPQRLLFSPDGKELTSFVSDKLERWEVTTGKMLAPLNAVEGATIQFTPDGKTLAVVDGSVLRLHDSTTAEVRRRIPCPPAPDRYNGHVEDETIAFLETVWKVVRPPFSGGVGDSGSAAAVVPVLAVGS